MEGATLDVLNNGQAFGTVAERLMANGMSVGAMRPYVKFNKNTGKFVGNFYNCNGVEKPIANALLRKDEWKQYDEALLKAAQQRLGGLADLYNAGLVYNINNGLGTTVLEYEDIEDIQGAQMNMDAVTQGQNDRPEFNMNYLPLPIIHADFQINIRVLEASRTRGQSLDTTTAELKTFKIMEYLESLLFVGTGGITYGGGTIYGYMNHPSRNTGSLTGNWDDESAVTGANVIEDVRNMKQASIDDYHYGPWHLYIPTNFETRMDDDYQSGYSKTIRNRILEIDGIQSVKVIDKLTADNVLLVQMTPDVIRIVNGLPLTTVEWNTSGGMISHYKIMTIQIPQVRVDANSRTGIVHFS
jgi:hypothetical protein